MHRRDREVVEKREVYTSRRRSHDSRYGPDDALYSQDLQTNACFTGAATLVVDQVIIDARTTAGATIALMYERSTNSGSRCKGRS